jgi:murein peptide amidase A
MTQALGRNRAGYGGEGIPIERLLMELPELAGRRGWQVQVFGEAGGLPLMAFGRRRGEAGPRVYLSAGIHGDEPAGVLAVVQLLGDAAWSWDGEAWVCPCLNPTGFLWNRRENAAGHDLNRDYRALSTDEVRAHVGWLAGRSAFDLAVCLHEDWESNGFYLYELDWRARPVVGLAEEAIGRVSGVCPVDGSEVIDGREACGGILRPEVDLMGMRDWPEAFYLIQHKTQLSYTLEAPSDFALPVRVTALVEGVKGLVEGWVNRREPEGAGQSGALC